ncbi:MAG TPA: hypothetical protein VND93_18645 [Myxococcales bacterium]|nr:hypothetical protein [Myxococcales bacterium]
MKLADARGAVRAAEQFNADQVSPASSYLALARQETAEGKQLLEVGRKQRAGYVLERAAADAELALALASEAPVRAEAQRTLDQVQQLQQGVGGSGTEVKP